MCPDNWDLRTGNLNDGVASEDSGSEKSFSELDEEEGISYFVSLPMSFLTRELYNVNIRYLVWSNPVSYRP